MWCGRKGQEEFETAVKGVENVVACSGGAEQDDLAVVGKVHGCPAVGVVGAVARWIASSVAVAIRSAAAAIEARKARFSCSQVERCKRWTFVLTEIV